MQTNANISIEWATITTSVCLKRWEVNQMNDKKAPGYDAKKPQTSIFFLDDLAVEWKPLSEEGFSTNSLRKWTGPLKIFRITNPVNGEIKPLNTTKPLFDPVERLRKFTTRLIGKNSAELNQLLPGFKHQDMSKVGDNGKITDNWILQDEGDLKGGCTKESHAINTSSHENVFNRKDIAKKLQKMCKRNTVKADEVESFLRRSNRINPKVARQPTG